MRLTALLLVLLLVPGSAVAQVPSDPEVTLETAASDKPPEVPDGFSQTLRLLRTPGFNAALAEMLDPGTTRKLGIGSLLELSLTELATQEASEALATQSRAEALLSRSIAFHDPEGRWGRDTIRYVWKGTGPEGEEHNAFEISITPIGTTFETSGRYGGSAIEYATAGESLTVAVEGSTEIDDQTRESLRLTRDGGMFWRHYFTYLVGLPMKLRDPGAILDPEPTSTEFMGRPVDSLRVTYDPEARGDTWYFYFDPATAELVGCRFYHDEAANDGEYIVFDGLIEADGLRIPRRSRWYVNADDRFLGEDLIESLVLGD